MESLTVDSKRISSCNCKVTQEEIGLGLCVVTLIIMLHIVLNRAFFPELHAAPQGVSPNLLSEPSSKLHVHVLPPSLRRKPSEEAPLQGFISEDSSEGVQGSPSTNRVTCGDAGMFCSVRMFYPYTPHPGCGAALGDDLQVSVQWA